MMSAGIKSGLGAANIEMCVQCPPLLCFSNPTSTHLQLQGSFYLRTVYTTHPHHLRSLLQTAAAAAAAKDHLMSHHVHMRVGSTHMYMTPEYMHYFNYMYTTNVILTPEQLSSPIYV